MAYRLTVLLPTLNCGKYLTDALRSLAAQTFQDFRVLILDGGSSDDTLDVASAFREVPIEIVRCGRIGLGRQLRVGVELVDTEYAARLDADDVSLPTRFDRQVRELDGRSDLAIIGSQIELLIGDKICPAVPLPTSHQDIRRVLWTGFPAFSHPTVLFRTEAAIRCSAYRIWGLGEDLDFYLRMTEAGKGENLPDVLHQYRLHGESASVRSFREVRKNYQFALECAKCRRKRIAEPTPDEYDARQSPTSKLVQRIASQIECRAFGLYRRSRIRMAEGKRVLGLAGACLSVLLRPKLIFSRVLVQLGRG